MTLHIFTGVRAKVIYSYHAQNDDELTLDEGQIIIVTDQVSFSLVQHCCFKAPSKISADSNNP